jgi:hypothetical protein
LNGATKAALNSPLNGCEPNAAQGITKDANLLLTEIQTNIDTSQMRKALAEYFQKN